MPAASAVSPSDPSDVDTEAVGVGDGEELAFGVAVALAEADDDGAGTALTGLWPAARSMSAKAPTSTRQTSALTAIRPRSVSLDDSEDEGSGELTGKD